MSKPIYRYILYIDGVPNEVNPTLDTNTNKVLEPDGDNRRAFRERITGQAVFYREEFDLIDSASFEAEFILSIEEFTGTWNLWAAGKFYKTDCTFHPENGGWVEVDLSSVDRYADFIAGLEKEYDLIRLGPALSTVNYQKQPLLQFYAPNGGFLVSFLSGVWFETVVDTPVNTISALNALGFELMAQDAVGIVTGVGEGLSPDVAGIYTQTPGSGGLEWKRADNVYRLFLQDIGFGLQWTIENIGTGVEVYTMPPANPLLDPSGPWHGSQAGIFTSTVSPSQCRFVAGQFFGRILTDKTDIGGTPTNPVPDPDIVPETFGYQYTLGLTEVPFEVSDAHQATPSRYGRFASDAIHFAGEYFIPPTGTGNDPLYPFFRSDWAEASFWFYYTSSLRDLQADGATQLQTKNAYLVEDAITALLEVVAPGVTFQASTTYSELLFATTNPVTGQPNPRLLITPKSNILVGDYDQPAQKAPVRLGELLTAIKIAYNADWFIDSNNRLRIEHITYFQNGGTYTGTNVGADLTALLEPTHSKPWETGNKSYRFDKQELPERLEFAWMDNTSEFFDGVAIDIRSRFIQEGKVDRLEAGRFTSDIDFAQGVAGSISLDGFFLLAGFDDGAGGWELQFLTVTLSDGRTWKAQNGHLAFTYLHDQFYRDGLPAPLVTINEIEETATTSKKIVIQEVEFATDQTLDPLALVTTSLGDGEIKRLEQNIDSRAITLTLEHDT